MLHKLKERFFKKKSSPEDAIIPESPAADKPPTPTPSSQPSWRQQLLQGLNRTSKLLSGLFSRRPIDQNLLDTIEDALLSADCGPAASAELINDLKLKLKQQKIENAEDAKYVLRDLLWERLKVLERRWQSHDAAPAVLMIMGVGGTGKTTSLGKLSAYFQDQGQTVLLAAADTFRAAAKEQLQKWGEYQGVTVISQTGNDAAAVVFDAIMAGQARKKNIILLDTAGRLPTQLHLMEELKKIKRVAHKAMTGAPHERWLVIDANNGQNVLSQVKAFDEAVQLTGLIVTKLDSSAKGGILVALAKQSQIPVYFIGVGEKIDALQVFNARSFANALLNLS